MIVACGFDHAGVPLRDRLLNEIAAAFLRAVISDEERHVRRRAKTDEIERTGGERDV